MDNVHILFRVETKPDCSFTDSLVLLNKTTTCFKRRGSCIDLLLTNQKYLFKNANAFGTSRSGHHLLIYSMLKTSF